MKKTSNKIIITISIITFFLLIVIFCWDCLTPSQYTQLTLNLRMVDWECFSINNIDVNSYIHTIASALIGFALTIIFIELILRKKQEEEIKRKKQLQLQNISIVLKIPILQYRKASLAISYRLGNIPKDQIIRIPLDTSVFNEIYHIANIIGEPLTETKIQFYSNTLTELKQVITNIILNVDLSDNLKLSNLLTEYLIFVSENNPCRELIEYKEKMIQPILNSITSNTLKNLSNNPNTIFYPFYKLQKTIDYHEIFIKKLHEIEPNLF